MKDSGRYTCLANTMDEEGLPLCKKDTKTKRVCLTKANWICPNGATNSTPSGSRVHAALQARDLGLSQVGCASVRVFDSRGTLPFSR